jgi:flagellar FliJ protein
VKRYRFRLETVLRVRRVQEDVARGDLARANAAVAAAAADVEAARERLAGMASEPVPANPVEWQARRALLLGRAAEITARQTDLQAADTERAGRQRALAEARTRVRALERLDERRRAEHAVEMGRDDSRTLDDLVTARWGRSS